MAAILLKPHCVNTCKMRLELELEGGEAAIRHIQDNYALMGRNCNWSRIDSILSALPSLCPSYGMCCILIQISLNLAPGPPFTNMV